MCRYYNPFSLAIFYLSLSNRYRLGLSLGLITASHSTLPICFRDDSLSDLSGGFLFLGAGGLAVGDTVFLCILSVSEEPRNLKETGKLHGTAESA